MENKNIKRKIKALLAKTETNGATKAEMLSALEKAQELMREHYISEHDLIEMTEIEKCEARFVDAVKSKYPINSIVGIIAKTFDCQGYRQGGEFCFFGFSHDLDLCEYFYTYISRTALAEKDRYIQQNSFLYPRREAYSFVLGFMHEVWERLEQMRPKAHEQGFGLMIYKGLKVKKQFNDFLKGTKLKKPRKKQLTVTTSYYTGKRKAKEISLSVGISTETSSNKQEQLTMKFD